MVPATDSRPDARVRWAMEILQPSSGSQHILPSAPEPPTASWTRTGLFSGGPHRHYEIYAWDKSPTNCGRIYGAGSMVAVLPPLARLPVILNTARTSARSYLTRWESPRIFPCPN